MRKIVNLNYQQKLKIDTYRHKWQDIAFSTKRINKKQVSSIIKKVYSDILNIREIDIYFFDSPLAIANLSFLNDVLNNPNFDDAKKINNIIRKIEKHLLKHFFRDDFFKFIDASLINQVGEQLDINLWNFLQKEFYFNSPLLSTIPINLKDREKFSYVWKAAKPNQKERLEQLWFYSTSGLITPDSKCDLCALLDYCISELYCTVDEHLWNILQIFVVECGWTFLFQHFCFACDRPCKLLLNELNQAHAEGETAIQFTDGFSIFAQNGVSP